MAKIIDNVKEMHRKIADEIDNLGTHNLADAVQSKAMNAALAGNKDVSGNTKQAWKDYMTLYVTLDGAGQPDAGQLARLCLEDAFGNEDWMKKAAAYLIGNGMCATPTTGNTRRNMPPEAVEIIDRPLPPQ